VVDDEEKAGEREREEFSWIMQRTVPQIDYIDKVPYRTADTRRRGQGGTVNGKDTSVEVESRPVDVCMYSARTWIGPKVVMGKGIGALRPRLDSAGRGRLVGG